jgi:hypothetical protein
MFADNDRRRGIVQDCRGSLRGVALVALAAALSAAAPATAAAVPGGGTTLKHSAGSGARGGENLLAGSPRIGTIRARVPRRGRDAGRLILWVRVHHAPGTPRALARERPETIHSGRVVARVGKRSRFATDRLELDGSRVARGYFLRFPRRATRALAAGGARRVTVSVRVTQTLDLDSDGDREDRALATTTRNVPLVPPATAIEPPDGKYVDVDPNGGSYVVVAQNYVTVVGLASVDPQGPKPDLCRALFLPDAGEYIDWQTGKFSFSDDPSVPGDYSISYTGQFNSDTELQLDATIKMTDGSCQSTINATLRLAPNPQ